MDKFEGLEIVVSEWDPEEGSYQSSTSLWICPICNAVVVDSVIHEGWHNNLALLAQKEERLPPKE